MKGTHSLCVDEMQKKILAISPLSITFIQLNTDDEDKCNLHNYSRNLYCIRINFLWNDMFNMAPPLFLFQLASTLCSAVRCSTNRTEQAQFIPSRLVEAMRIQWHLHLLGMSCGRANDMSNFVRLWDCDETTSKLPNWTKGRKRKMNNRNSDQQAGKMSFTCSFFEVRSRFGHIMIKWLLYDH